MAFTIVRPTPLAIGVALLACVLLPTRVTTAGPRAPDPSTDAVEVTFTHLGSTGDVQYDRSLNPGQTLKVRILQTCDAFDIAIRGIVRAEEPGPSAQSGGVDLPLKEREVSTVHETKYGGYVVSITRNPKARRCQQDEKLQNRLIFIAVKTLDWNVAFSGGFTMSSLRDPVYSARTGDDGKKRIVQEAGKQDSAALGIAAFVHLYHEKLPQLAISFGLGVRDDNKSQFYLGGGYRFSDKATIVTGMVFGPQGRLPNGVALNDEVTDANVLGSTSTRTGKGFFVGLSYSFIQVGDRFQKPFAGTGSGESGGGSGSGSGERSSAAAGSCPVSLRVPGSTSDLKDIQLNAAGTLDGKEPVLTVLSDDKTCEWAVTVDPIVGGSAWLSADPTTVKAMGTLSLKVEANTLTTPREAKVTFTPKAGGATAIQVIQKPKA